MKRPLPNTYWVIDGQLLAGEYPGGNTVAETRKRLDKLLEAGIDSFIDLTETGEREAYRGLLPREVDYYHRPLPDHSVPADVASMHEALAVLRNALGAGRKVYVHCRAGIGRTGITIACHLTDGGRLDGEQALTRLNELWQQNARARRWPRVPETEAQAAFVRQFSPATVPVASSRVDRARGALLGLAVGDALAVSLTGAPSGTPVPAQFAGGGPDALPPGVWTDETAMALCLADSLLACQGTDTRDQADRYLRWLRDGHRSATGEAVGVRPELRRSLALAATRHSALSGSHDPRVLDSEPLARCAPPALYFLDDLAAAAEGAADAARVTHQAPVLVDACRLFAGLLHTALTGGGLPAILAHHEVWRGILKPEVMDVADAWGAGPGAGGRRPRGAILLTLDAVVRSLAAASDFRAGLTALLSLPIAHRGEADVAGAAYGQLAGAFFGEHGIPQGLRGAVIDGGEIATLAESLLPATSADADSIPQGLQSR